ncbi:hypothetical protein [Enterococcus sp. BWR-S5]|uniref:hypothetical protein n=1 Tax=Enterococcus sp. BWR-S5 TaxID=2787714 RepID=UPI0019216975|nr:hypothetical protein [Enterococcus sp. BWR-S5]MBL1226244.1 hypothetical protein [Enterococcus sp. BWR-S5]
MKKMFKVCAVAMLLVGIALFKDVKVFAESNERYKNHVVLKHYLENTGELYKEEKIYFEPHQSFDPSVHYIDFRSFTEVEGEPYTDLEDDTTFELKASDSGRVINYFYDADAGPGPVKLTLKHFVTNINAVYKEETFFFNNHDTFSPAKYYIDFSVFTETSGTPYTDLLSEDPFELSMEDLSRTITYFYSADI